VRGEKKIGKETGRQQDRGQKAPSRLSREEGCQKEWGTLLPGRTVVGNFSIRVFPGSRLKEGRVQGKEADEHTMVSHPRTADVKKRERFYLGPGHQ